jgi:hypothetical protein
MSYNNFTGGNIARKLILSSLVPKFTLKDSIKIYFIFSEIYLFSMHFRILLDFLEIKKETKIKNRENSTKASEA